MPHILLHHHLPIAPVHLRPFSFPTSKPTAYVRLRTNPTRGATIKCMANPRRVKIAAKQIRRELSDMLLTDKVLQYAFLTEAALGADRYLSSLTTVSDVEVSSDFQGFIMSKLITEKSLFPDTSKLYTTLQCIAVSAFGDERGKEIALAGLKSKAKYARSELGKRMKLRLTPEIRFIEDEWKQVSARVIAILDRITAEKKIAADEGEKEFESSDSPQDDRDWEGDGDIIYVK
ncbi:probable ribosome-binding factor A, chloroplastic [Durio zibethinus]|uniref:Probable ribosome-binding factor A, chloroplastic n=1 Tax=Durio zibethinus TaxID=66656 RepID=A0A6P6ABE0_DURZI|nr:probable ribosome-binding factor A, chloroplastic [Durio zibethinus]